jgi:hypothetical protein
MKKGPTTERVLGANCDHVAVLAKADARVAVLNAAS